jgi:TfoX/Sxy family transcriptional regulator of competence genes
MACTQEYVDYVVDQIDSAGEIVGKKMFGGFSMYSDGRLFALICDDKLFVKPTEAGRTFIKDVVEAPAFKGAKLSFLIEEKQIKNRGWISELVKITIAALPDPKPKKKRPKKASKKQKVR